MFNKKILFEIISRLISKNNLNYDTSLINKVINDIKIGMGQDMNENTYYDYVANTCASYICIEPEFSKVATYFVLKKLNNIISQDYGIVLENLINSNMLHDNYIDFCKNNVEWINSILCYDRDYDIDYFGIKTLERSYLLKFNNNLLELPQHMFLRCAIQIHNPNKDKIKETYDYISKLYFTHATPTLFNSGTKYPQLSSCFLLQIPDDLNGISKSCNQMMMISKWAGGIGLNLSSIRGRNSIIKTTGGKTDGIVPLCKLIESIGRYCTQGGRRAGSIACYIEPWHNDIFEFLELRKNTGDENLRARDLFLGLWIPDLFMKQVENDDVWYLFSPDIAPKLNSLYGEEFETYFWKLVEEEKYTKKIKAQELYTKILECQFESGIPYMLYKDAANKKSNQKNLGTIKNSNLCVAPETKILTQKGEFEIQHFENYLTSIWNGHQWSDVIVRKTGENQKLIKITFSNDKFIECTPYHKFYINKDNITIKCDASELVVGDELISYKMPDDSFHENITVISIEDNGRIDDTYCFMEPYYNMGIFNGILTGQCSEIIEYSDDNEIAVCNLSSICLPSFVEDGIFNFEELGKVVQIITENLNNIIDINFYPVSETRYSNLKNRPIGIGVQGLADTYLKMNLAFDSDEANLLNKNIFECIYFNALTKSMELAKKYGSYETFKDSPFSKGLLQFDLWEQNHDNQKWNELKENIKKYGVRNSLLTTIMPTASTSQIMNNNESIEPYTTNLYLRKTMAGEFIIVNKHLIKDLQKLDLWNQTVYNEILYDNGSVQKLDIPYEIKNKYKTAFELKQSSIIKQSIDRAIYIDQSQSLNLFIATPNFSKLHSCHMYAWKNGLKTGMYYLRSQPAVDAIKFGIDPKTIDEIKSKRAENQVCSLKRDNNNEPCLVCSS